MDWNDRRLSALESLYRNDFESFLRVAVGIVGDRGLALDAVQEGFARAIKARAGFRGHGSLEGWVWRIVVNEALGSRRRRLAEPPADLPETNSNGHPVDDDAALRAAIAVLPDRQRAAIFLRYFADLEYATIAEVLGVRIGTVSATLSAAHASMRETLQEVER